MSDPQALRLPVGVVWHELAVDVAGGRAAERGAGRRAAASALLELGSARTDVPTAPVGAPVFPSGYAGSITHDGGRAAAVVARSATGFDAVGADVHHVRPLSPSEAAYLADADELGGATRAAGAAGVHVVFALKEAVFKAVSAREGSWLEFADISLTVLPDGHALLHRPAREGAVLRWQLTGSLVRAVALLPVARSTDGVSVGDRSPSGPCRTPARTRRRQGGAGAPPAAGGRRVMAVLLAAGVLAACWAVALHLRRAADLPWGRYDSAWAERVGAAHTPVLDGIAQVLADLGGPPLGILVVIGVGVLLGALRGVLPTAVFFAAAGISEGDVLAMKWLARRPTPEGLVPHGFGSFPSGHTANAALIAVTLALVLGRAWIWPIGGLVVTAMALDRTYLDAHWLTDTVAGAAAGSAVAVIAWCCAPPRLRSPRREAGSVESSGVEPDEGTHRCRSPHGPSVDPDPASSPGGTCKQSGHALGGRAVTAPTRGRPPSVGPWPPPPVDRR